MSEPRCAQLRALRLIDGHPPGTLYWERPTRAREVIFVGAAQFVNSVDLKERERPDGILCKSALWPVDRLSTVKPTWRGAVAVIIAGGPSLTQEQVALVHRAREAGTVRVIAVNDAYLWAPWADVMYASDSSWWQDHARGIDKPLIRISAAQQRERFEAFAGERCSIQDAGGGIEDDRVHIVRNGATNPQGESMHRNGLSLDPTALLTGQNSGWQAINLAALAGAAPLILLGFDGAPGTDGRSHWSGGHRCPTPQQAYDAYRQAFSAGADGLRAAGIPCYNASPGSRYDSFDRLTLEDALKLCA